MADFETLQSRIEDKWKRKQAFHRDLVELKDLISIKAFGKLLDNGGPSWFSALYHDEEVKKQRPNLDFDSALMGWVTARMRMRTPTTNWFVISEGLTYKFLATEMKGVVVGDVRLPMEGFRVEIPPGILWTYDRTTRYHEVRSLAIASGEITQETVDLGAAQGDPSVTAVLPGKRLLVMMEGMPNERSKNPFDDSWSFFVYNTSDPTAEVSAGMHLHYNTPMLQDEWATRSKTMRIRLVNTELAGEDARAALLRFVCNLCLYMSSEKADVVFQHEQEIARLMQGKKPKQLRQVTRDRIARLKNDRVFLVGTSVEVSAVFREAVAKGGVGEALTYRTLVRGHWRNQAYGKAWAERKKIWIEPHIRGAELPTPVAHHNYIVKEST